MAAPRGISQPPTSFIGSQCQGIHHAPLNTYKHKTKFDKRNCTSTHQHTTTHPERPAATHSRARCSQPLSTNQTPHPTTKDGATTRPPNPQAQAPPQEGHGLVVSKPNSVFDDPAPATPPTTTFVVHQTPRHYSNGIPHGSTTPRWGGVFVVLLRKEVIQPHLPVRLPCYDFVPIADPTFDGSLPYGLGHRLRVLPTFMT